MPKIPPETVVHDIILHPLCIVYCCSVLRAAGGWGWWCYQRPCPICGSRRSNDYLQVAWLADFPTALLGCSYPSPLLWQVWGECNKL